MPGRPKRQRRRAGGGAAGAGAPRVLHLGLSPDDRVRSAAARGHGGDRQGKRSLPLSDSEEGVLYTVKLTRPPSKPRLSIYPRESYAREADEDAPPPQAGGTWPATKQPQQYTITKMKKKRYTLGVALCRFIGVDLSRGEDVDSYLYKPSNWVARYINWSFYASFHSVFVSFLGIFIVLCLFFAGLMAAAGAIQPECMIVSGEHYGANPDTKFGDAFTLSWTTFTTVGYGNVYPTTGNDYVYADTKRCSGMVFLCTVEAFLGLIYAGMCTSIMFGKVNRIQSHAHITFANAICLQYEEVDLNEFVDDDSQDSDFNDDLEGVDEDDDEDDGCDTGKDNRNGGEDNPSAVTFKDMPTEETTRMQEKRKGSVTISARFPEWRALSSFRKRFKGCPVLKFQVVNDFCNQVGGEIIDGYMKAIGIKMKRQGGMISHSQYVRVGLVDFEHPFFGRVWHGVHILDATSPLLTNAAREKVRETGQWPLEWFQQPAKIRKKLDFHSLVVTVSGTSNVSACSVHAYKRYKFEDVIVGFDYSPLVYEDERTGKLKVDMTLLNDVREQHKGHGEDLKSGMPLADEDIGEKGMRGEQFSRGGSNIFTVSAGHTG